MSLSNANVVWTWKFHPVTFYLNELILIFLTPEMLIFFHGVARDFFSLLS